MKKCIVIFISALKKNYATIFRNFHSGGRGKDFYVTLPYCILFMVDFRLSLRYELAESKY